MSRRGTNRTKLVLAGAVMGWALALAGQAAACMPASGPPPTPEQFADRQTAFQASLWANADTVLIAAVTKSDVADRTLNVTLAPSMVIKGEGPAPAPFVVSDAMSNCRPGGIMGAGGVAVGEVYVVYRNAHGDLVVHEDELRDPSTRAAWTEARGG
jgi:hypothetical protein